MKKQIVFALFLGFSILVFGKSNAQLALTPPMGWNSWNCFHQKIDEKQIMEIADAMLTSGLKDAGYIYLNLDDCWMSKKRDENGRLQSDSVRFPSGMKALADYVHSKGLKFGIYTAAGTCTCAKGDFPGSWGNEELDIQTFASWGVDYVKVDKCKVPSDFEQMKIEKYTLYSNAIKKCGRPMIYSVCAPGSEAWKWAPEISQLWRTSTDISPSWYTQVHDKAKWVPMGIDEIINKNTDLRKYAAPGRWNDPDMLQVGNGKLTQAENTAHFTMWAMLSAPLIAGNDLRVMKENVKQILTNKEVIAIDQDVLGIQALKYKTIDSIDVWVKPLMNKKWAVCFLNRAKSAKKINYDWAKNIVIDELAKMELNTNKIEYKLRDVWANKSIGTTKRNLTVSLDSHAVQLLVLDKK
jgi:alpha-galactosidase